MAPGLTRDSDRKGVVVERILHFLKTNKILDETCSPAAVVSRDRLAKAPSRSGRLFYGQYDKANGAMLSLLKKISRGQFEDEAMARIVARSFWTRAVAPTSRNMWGWFEAKQEHTQAKSGMGILSKG
jgi:hypothetical protein